MPTKIITIGAVPLETTGADVANAGPVTPAAYDQNIANLRAAVDRRALVGGSTSQAFAASGIAFPATQVASADPNTLDDYEEGTFTPVIIGSITAGVGTYTKQSGTYTKVGNLVTFITTLGWSAHTGTGNLYLLGLPFAIGSPATRQTIFNCFFDGLTVGTGKQVSVSNITSGAAVALYTNDLAGGATGLVALDAVVTTLAVTGTHQV